MSRIQITTDDLRLERLDQLGEEITKSTPDVSRSAKRNAAFDYLVDAVVSSAQNIKAMRADISRLNGVIQELEPLRGLDVKLDEANSSLSDTKDDLALSEENLAACKSKCARLEEAIEGMLLTIEYLTVERK